ncbi:MAG: ATP-dependent exonuclease SbcCD, C subunit-like protein [Deltaproteobacteria bacterium]|nr:ATP-dependent exonuclease SbcCD, C subunit-like protein [Deltaproteobacteria bacterium]
MTVIVNQNSELLLDFSDTDEHSGFRLVQLEVYNWGTFHHHIWQLNLNSANTLLTGDIGSGKSTLVDAITTLLVPPQKLTFNKAAGAEVRERTLRSYVLGYYKTERSETSLSARPVALREANDYSVILCVFFNKGYNQYVTLAQVFWSKDLEGQPARFFIVAESPFTISKHFSDFGSDISELRKRLKKLSCTEVFDAFSHYSASFRRRFGIENEQALELFNQTVSMKSVGNLTDFVRQHMLEAFAVEERVKALIAHYDDLNRVHAAVLKAEAQITQLTPIVNDCNRHAALTEDEKAQRACRDAIMPYFASLKVKLLDKRLRNLNSEIEQLGYQIDAKSQERRDQQIQRDELKSAINANGGDRLERIKATINERTEKKAVRQKRAAQYERLARVLEMPIATNAEIFIANRHSIENERITTTLKEAQHQNDRTEVEVEFRTLKTQHEEINREINSLKQRRSSIPLRNLDLRTKLCEELNLTDEALPFAGELLQVHEDAHIWEGAIERVLHNFGLSLLVRDTEYSRVAEWVNNTHLGSRLVYYRIHLNVGVSDTGNWPPTSLMHKIAIRPDSEFYNWLEAEILRRFNYTCCDTLDQFRREKMAITSAGQIKGAGERHEKDDRCHINDRSRYILGWSNNAKINALEIKANSLEQHMQIAAKRINSLQAAQRAISERLTNLEKLDIFDNFYDIDWRPLAIEIEALDHERRELEEESDILRTLESRLVNLEQAINTTEATLDNDRRELGIAKHKQQQYLNDQEQCELQLSTATNEILERDFPRLELLRAQALGEHTLSVESCANRERELHAWLQREIDAITRKLERLQEKIVAAIQAFRHDYPAETQEIDASINASDELTKMLKRLCDDDLPRFKGRFKELLNENTIREIANFQSQLHRERQTIKERIELINRSLMAIDYNPGRYIRLEMHPAIDIEIRDFQTDLRACTEGTLTGSDETEYSEAKFIQVKHVIERFRGREGSSEIDRRWTHKVTDVRNWFNFSASERWREDDREQEHYTDSGGKSGGQKEKLAYTILAASLAYQFGLEHGVKRSRSFRFVVIDEAFGRGSDESARYALKLFNSMNLQLLIVTPLQKIHVIEPFVANVGFIHSEEGKFSKLHCLTIEEYRAERQARQVTGKLLLEI